MENNWIKMSERKPTAADLPVWTWNKMDQDIELWSKADGVPLFIESLPFWRHATADIPAPPKEPTQREEDIVAFDNAWYLAKERCKISGGGWFTEGWNAALAYRDRQNANDIACLSRGCIQINNLRRRCGLDQ